MTTTIITLKLGGNETESESDTSVQTFPDASYLLAGKANTIRVLVQLNRGAIALLDYVVLIIYGLQEKVFQEFWNI